ncbi:hypothetical protein FGB62_144g13 [Gracilaria domingensis]|nr:hypothetical protein FGB62_144g13 [Gracilaria domingensis]
MRNVDSLRRKFAGLHRQKVSTGNSHCPSGVQRAKRIHGLIKEKSEIGNAQAEDEFGVEDAAKLEKTTDLDEELGKDAKEVEDITEHGAIQVGRFTNNNATMFNTRRRVHPRRKKDEEDEYFVTLYKLSIMEDQKNRQEQRKLEADRAEREHERAIPESERR